MWNCLWRAGGSIIHGHAQVTATRGSHYPKVERLRRVASAYKREHGSDYFEDLTRVHGSLGLDIPPEGVRAFASLSPIKEKELVVIGRNPETRSLSRTVGALLQGYVQTSASAPSTSPSTCPRSLPHRKTGQTSPLSSTSWTGATLSNRTSDMGAMELYAASVVASDPFRVAEALRERGSGPRWRHLEPA